MARDTRFPSRSACCALLVLLALTAGAEFGEPIARSGKWTVRRTFHAITEEPACVASYKDRFDIQLDENDLFVGVGGRGDMASVVLRFDDKPAKASRPASETEKKLGAVNLRGEEFEELMSSVRLRMQIRTTAGATIEEDLDLGGVKGVHGELVGSRCRSEKAR